MNKEKLNANMEYLKGLCNKSNELKEEYDVIDKNETEYIIKFFFISITHLIKKVAKPN